MPLMRAVVPAWLDSDLGRVVHRGEEFETSEYHARDLALLGHAVYAMPEASKVVVTADPPPEPEPEPEQPEPVPAKPAASPRKAPAKRKSR